MTDFVDHMMALVDGYRYFRDLYGISTEIADSMGVCCPPIHIADQEIEALLNIQGLRARRELKGVGFYACRYNPRNDTGPQSFGRLGIRVYPSPKPPSYLQIAIGHNLGDQRPEAIAGFIGHGLFKPAPRRLYKGGESGNLVDITPDEARKRYDANLIDVVGGKVLELAERILEDLKRMKV